MKKTRIYFLVPDQKAAENIADSLYEEGVDQSQIQAVVNEDQRPLASRIPEAGIIETSDITSAAKRGAGTGAFAGLLLGLVIMSFLVPHMLLAIVTGALLIVVGAIIGSWVATMIGVSVPNTKLHAFQEAIDQGKILLLVDINPNQADRLKKLMQTRYPDPDMCIATF